MHQKCKVDFVNSKKKYYLCIKLLTEYCFMLNLIILNKDNYSALIIINLRNYN